MPISEVLDDGVDVPMLIKEEPDNYAAVPEPITHIPDDSDHVTMFMKEESDNDVDVLVQIKKEPCDGANVQVPLKLEPDDVVDVPVPLKLEPDGCANAAVPIKKEPDNCIPQTVLSSNLSYVKLYQQQSADQNYYEVHECKNNIPIIKIAPILIDSLSQPKKVNQTIKSEHEDACKSSGTSTQTAVQSSLILNTTTNLYEVKDECPCTPHTEAVYNNRFDVGSELVEVSGELDCKPEIVGNANNAVVLGDVNIPSSVEHKDTVNQLSGTPMECGIVKKENNAFGK